MKFLISPMFCLESRRHLLIKMFCNFQNILYQFNICFGVLFQKYFMLKILKVDILQFIKTLPNQCT